MAQFFFLKKTIILNHDWPFLRLINLKCFKGWIPVGAFAKIPSKKLNCALQKISHLGTNILKLLNAWGFIPPDHVVKDGFFKWTNPGHFLFIFVLFKHKFYRKNCRLQLDSNWDRRSIRQARWPLDHHGPDVTKIFQPFCGEGSMVAYTKSQDHKILLSYYHTLLRSLGKRNANKKRVHKQ